MGNVARAVWPLPEMRTGAGTGVAVGPGVLIGLGVLIGRSAGSQSGDEISAKESAILVTDPLIERLEVRMQGWVGDQLGGLHSPAAAKLALKLALQRRYDLLLAPSRQADQGFAAHLWVSISQPGQQRRPQIRRIDIDL